ncbi:carbohydrate esterase family 1 protein [Thermothelomyces thermophilus ATCC 42464]|uniref:Feruloyl esterase B n=2 Tax=leotiomyceta TaxID=716546 RepID=FAEB_THET4|nr:carbohydrate esterase family 1 protein [Thermothelomyces thermophilus ATCC 42464]G2QND5.1 RecName: Full=Feruloyl esterase B; AltName: Full=Cinnamoyl esterase; AltName: Full=Ferulic acid esterase B; Short=FAEB; Flags: Precursor [Thermothelomyces thermophilus ATCC 42464]AEO62008.1 carbohydrate esterase family 1 protein [Thermothelomyces thermophilus ATCC 42464]AEP33618.1 feruloyl esterase B2 [Chrysosporium lucknowense]AWH66431.1 MTFae1a [synthetic construct]
MLVRSFLGFAVLAATCLAASLQEVTEFGDNPTNIQMYIYVPDQLDTNPPVIVALHPCGGSAQQWFSGTQLPSYADDNGFILIYPSTPHMSNCWDIQNPDTLTHGQGGDALGIVSMVNYTLDKHSGDSSRVYAMGFSSGGMMTNQLAGSYPDVFEAGAVYSGVAFGCAAGAESATPFSPNQTCAQGLQKTAQEWGDFVRNAYAGYTGRRPRMQIFHGLEDTLVRPQCAEEALKQWSNVLGVELTQEVSGVPSPGWTQKIYGDGTQLQGFFGQGIGHQSTVNEQQLLQWFGLI